MKFKEVLYSKKYSVLLIFFIILFNPFFFFWADNLSVEVKIYAWITCIVVASAFSGITCFLKNKGEKIYLTTLYLLSLVPNVVVWTYLFISDTYMQRDMYWVIFGSNSSESKEYVHQFITLPIFIAAFVYVFTGIFLLIKSVSAYALSIKKFKSLFITCIVLIALSLSFQYLTKSICLFDFYKSGIQYYNESRKMINEFETRKNLKMDVDCMLSDSVKHTFVVVIGESLSNWHMQLYGYQRETTPLLNERKNDLEIYTDVTTPDTHTIGVLKKVLTFANRKHPEYYLEKPSIIELFESAGFKTYWISNQELISKWGGSYGVIASESDEVYDLRVAQQDDEIVLPYLSMALKDTTSQNKIIFIHLMGSHSAYEVRYPEEYNYFDHEKDGFPNQSFQNEEMKKTIDYYDNSVRYTDFVVNSVIAKVDSLSQSSFVLFFSDHGDEVFDITNRSGHHMTNVNQPQCDIPFILWKSDAYKNENPEIEYITNRPYSIENLIFSLSDLSKLKYKDYNPQLSIFSSQYKVPEKRMVGNEDYETIKKKHPNAWK